ncbi:MAG TPA: ribonuclease H-like domain-containing protein, partial [Blastocatellia bacterium]|nr:ribonuclease H-like domain-containing protein [Blastocatellia bacterium]
MKGNVPIPDLQPGDDIWLTVVVTSAREVRPQQGKPFHLASARNASGTIAIKIPGEILQTDVSPKPGLWGIVGRVETFQGQQQFVLSEFRPITVEKYRELQNADPLLPRAFTIDIETIPLPAFKERVAARLKRANQLGRMSEEQQQRYFEDPTAEEERAFRSGSLAATSGRVLSIAIHVGPIPGVAFEGIQQSQSENVFGIDSDGQEQAEQKALTDFLAMMRSFDPDVDEIVGHNVIGFDLPFIFQRCLVNNIAVRPFVNLADFNVRGVYDTMHRWWLGSKNRVSLDDIAWALGIESSKTGEVEGSRVFEFYQAGRLNEIREYNLNDVRVTRQVYERIV